MDHLQILQTQLIVDTFQQFRMAPLPIDEYEQKGKLVLIDKIASFVDQSKPIDFVMLGFPMKSPNDRDKVLGKLPDKAEEVTFDNFSLFGEKIKSIYQPGINLNVVSDGYIFSDIMEVSDNTVAEYEERSMDMAKGSPVVWHDINSFYSNGSIETKRQKTIEQFGITPDELERRILMDPDVNHLYRGMIKFLTLDLAIKNFPSNEQLHKAAKRLAREMMFRNEAYSKLVQSEFSSNIRLSMHPSINNGTKYSFQLIPSKLAWTSPWHCALLITKDNEYATIHKKDALKNNFELVYKNSQPYYFQEI